MKQTSMILMSDYYKQAHAEQYPEGITKLISYATARMTRIPKEMMGDKLTVFGIQAYVKDFLIERFNDTFFNVPLEEAMAEYEMIIGDTFPIQYVNTGKFEALHKLGYLPVEVGCLAEGTRVPIRSAFELPEGQCQVPFMYIINTHPDFPWITEFLESVTSSEVWYPMAIANQAYYYRQIVNEWYNKTGCAPETRKSAISEFGFRGGKSSDAAIKASAAFLTSFNKTATIPAIKYMHDYYGDPIKEIGGGMISTEHSVMCSNYAVDKSREFDSAVDKPREFDSFEEVIDYIDKQNSDVNNYGNMSALDKEITRTVVVKDKVMKVYMKHGAFGRRLLYNELGKETSYYEDRQDVVFQLSELQDRVNMYMDTIYLIKGECIDGNEYYNTAYQFTEIQNKNAVVDKVEETFLKKLFGELYPTGAVSVVMDTYDYWENLKNCGHGQLKEIIMNRPGTVFFRGDSGDPVDIICGERVPHYKNLEQRKLSRSCDTLFYSDDEQCWYKFRKEDGKDMWDKYSEEPVESLGTVGLLAKMFGYTVNQAGYKVLDSHVRAIYGDSITPNRANQIYQRLAEKGFASNNVALGAGSFSTQCAETPDGRLLPFTRDSYGIAVKCCYIEDIDGNTYEVFKNPKTDTGKFKKSQRGMIWVGLDENGEIIAKDGYTTDTLPEDNLLQPIFRDGKMIKETTLAEIRNRLHNGDF